MNPSSADLSIVTLVMNASVVVQCVLGILVLASLMSWATIFSKAIVLSRTARQTEEFEKRFWSGADLAKLFESATSRHDRTQARTPIGIRACLLSVLQPAYLPINFFTSSYTVWPL